MLEMTTANSADRKIEAMTTIIYSMGLDRFGVEEVKKTGGAPRENRRRIEIANIRGDLRRLTRQYRQSAEEERAALEELRKPLRQHLKALRRAENHRRKRRERMQKRAKFTANPG